MQPVLDIHVQTTLESPGRRFALDARFVSTTARTALIGMSGSGKSTALMAIAGLLPQVRGHVRVAGRTLLDTADAVDLPARERRVGLVFQDYALFPHMTVEQNLAFGLCRLGQRPSEIERARIDALLRQFDLDTLRGAWPRHLSGGQRHWQHKQGVHDVL
ncbi:MAG TPA: ATP-binding cassette domain-containing protein, partial [Variovorax sp.]